MKKFTLFVAALFFAGAANAQDMTSKRGVNILPEAGDISISMNANPFLDYVGTVLSAGGAGSTNFVQFLTTDNFIAGRYFLDETKAVRGGIRIGFGSTSSDNLVVGGASGNTTFTETDKTSYNNITLTGGLEFRRGNYGRFQGYYGGELLIGFGGQKTTDEEIVDVTEGYKQTTEVKQGTTIKLGLQGFIGVEYFLAPKVALGGEFTWGLMLQSTGEGETTVTDTTPGAPAIPATKTGKGSNFSLDTGTGFTGGNLKLSFFF
ncbi:MAG: hypothetical protein KF690_01305 [Bacteroidetes bacterium]|nr:hypothetical protein [Bacteroidota bacterium]